VCPYHACMCACACLVGVDAEGRCAMFGGRMHACKCKASISSQGSYATYLHTSMWRCWLMRVGYGMAAFPCDAHVVLFREAATGKATATKLASFCLRRTRRSIPIGAPATMPTGGTSAIARAHADTVPARARSLARCMQHTGQCMFSLGPPLV